MMDPTAVSIWDNLLANNIPLVGKWMRRKIARIASARAKAGNVGACAALSRAIDTNKDPIVRQIAHETLQSCRSTFCIDAAWQVWAQFRGQNLAETLIQTKNTAKTPPLIRALSLLLLQDTSALASAPASLIEPIVFACSDHDSLLSTRARYALTHLNNPIAISSLCTLWSKTRSPLLENTLAQAGYQPDAPVDTRVLVALKFYRLALVTHSSAEVIRPLLAACDDNDADIRDRAQFCLINLQNPAAIDELCTIWAHERSELTANAIRQARYVARQPVPARILSALKTDRMDIAQNLSSTALPVLLAATMDTDSEIAGRANLALHNLTSPETREKLCDLAIDEDNALARQIALDSAYRPLQPERRALFLFLTDQWSEYDTLDFDQSLLNRVYSASSTALRQRIMRKIQQTGRTDYLTILAGSDHRTRTALLSPIEAQLLVRILSAGQEWEKLWLLVKELDLTACKDALVLLSTSGYQPKHPTELAAFSRLCTMAAMPLSLTLDEFTRLLPPAVPRAVLKLNGRVNDVAFQVGENTHLAIALGSKRVVVWDYQSAKIETVHRAFEHSVSRVAYTPSGTLIASERSVQAAPCGVYILGQDKPQRIGEHDASITALKPTANDRVLTASRDSTLALWDLPNQRIVHSRSLAGWARAVCISPDFQKAVLLKQSLEIVQLDDLQPLSVARRRTKTNGRVFLTAAVLSNDLDLLVGMYNGDIFAINQSKASPRSTLIRRQRGASVGIQTLADHHLVISASSAAELCFYSLPDLRLISSPPVSSNRITSLQLSPDGAFMATGTGDSTMTLWDLRLLDLPQLFTRPLAAMHPSQLTTINSLLEIEVLPEPVRNSLLLFQALLQYRFAFDIHIEETSGIRAGEFDVLID